MTDQSQKFKLFYLFVCILIFNSCVDQPTPCPDNDSIQNTIIKFDLDNAPNLTNLDGQTLMPIKNDDFTQSFRSDSITITDSVILLVNPTGDFNLPSRTTLEEGEAICKNQEKSVSTMSIGSANDLLSSKNTEPQGKFSIADYIIISPNRYEICFQLKKAPFKSKCYSIKNGSICIVNIDGNYEVYITR